LGFLETDVGKIAAIPGVPAERRPPELRGLVHQEEDELERVGQAHEVEFCGRGEGDRRIARVERATQAPIRRALGSHEQMFP
jgi:hypothetical protein